jgi:hypothetical protein
MAAPQRGRVLRRHPESVVLSAIEHGNVFLKRINGMMEIQAAGLSAATRHPLATTGFASVVDAAVCRQKDN